MGRRPWRRPRNRGCSRCFYWREGCARVVMTNDPYKALEPDETGVPDEGALVAAAQRDPRDFGPLYELYVDRIYRYAYRRVGTHHEAEDITAQTFQQALQALPNYQWRGLPFGAWLFRIAGNIINRRGRTSGREVAVEDVTVFSGYEPTDDD